MSGQMRSLRHYDHGVTIGITKAGLCLVKLNNRLKGVYSSTLVAERAVDAILVRIATRQTQADAR